jgi:hypothetical protein
MEIIHWDIIRQKTIVIWSLILYSPTKVGGAICFKGAFLRLSLITDLLLGSTRFLRSLVI